MANLKRTPLYEEHLKLGAKIVDFAGWEMPIQYNGITEEHLTVRNYAGLFDVSHMGEIYVTGIDAEKYIEWITTADIVKLRDNQIVYTMMCYENGGVIDDLLIYKFSSEKFLFVVNASNTDKDYEWMLRHKGSFAIQVDNRSDEYGQVALQGPRAQILLQTLTEFDLNLIKFFYFAEIIVDGINCLVSRTGYTGEDGFEIYASKEDIAKIWRVLLNLEGVKPIGLGARDTLRFEANLPLYGNEIGEDITPVQAGLGFFVKFNTNFIGKNIMLKLKEAGLKRKLVGLKLLKGICRHGYPVCDLNEKEIGYVTTGYKIPGHEEALAQAYVDIEQADLDNKVLINIRNRFYEAVVVPRKFLNKKNN